MNPLTKSGDTATQIQITRALSQPGAKGKRGFLLWVNAAFPKQIADRITVAASRHLSPGGHGLALGGLGRFGYGPRTLPIDQRVMRDVSMLGGVPGIGRWSERNSFVGPFGRWSERGSFAGLGYTVDITPGLTDITVDPTLTQIPQSASDAITAATDSAPADPSWLSSVSSAIQAAGQAYLTKTQVDSASQIFNINLQRAQAGLPPIPTNPTQYGLPAPTVNLGLAAGTLTPLLWVGGGIAALALLASLSSRRH